MSRRDVSQKRHLELTERVTRRQGVPGGVGLLGVLEYVLSPSLLWRPEPWSRALLLAVTLSGLPTFFIISFLSIKWGDTPELTREGVYHDNNLSQCFGGGASQPPHETSGVMPNHGKCPVALLWRLP